MWIVCHSLRRAPGSCAAQPLFHSGLTITRTPCRHLITGYAKASALGKGGCSVLSGGPHPRARPWMTMIHRWVGRLRKRYELLQAHRDSALEEQLTLDSDPDDWMHDSQTAGALDKTGCAAMGDRTCYDGHPGCRNGDRGGHHDAYYRRSGNDGTCNAYACPSVLPIAQNRAACPRSVMLVSCTHMRTLAKLLLVPADCFILDLADTVAPGHKSSARENVYRYITSRVDAHRRYTDTEPEAAAKPTTSSVPYPSSSRSLFASFSFSSSPLVLATPKATSSAPSDVLPGTLSVHGTRLHAEDERSCAASVARRRACQLPRFVIRINSPERDLVNSLLDLEMIGLLGRAVEGVAVPSVTQQSYDLIADYVHPEYHSLWAFFSTAKSVMQAGVICESGHFQYAVLNYAHIAAELQMTPPHLCHAGSGGGNEHSTVMACANRREREAAVPGHNAAPTPATELALSVSERANLRRASIVSHSTHAEENGTAEECTNAHANGEYSYSSATAAAATAAAVSRAWGGRLSPTPGSAGNTDALYLLRHLPLWCCAFHVVLASRAQGMHVLDGAISDPTDHAALRSELSHSQAFGLDGKVVTHVDQVAVTNEMYMPAVAEVAWARRVRQAVVRSRESENIARSSNGGDVPASLASPHKHKETTTTDERGMHCMDQDAMHDHVAHRRDPAHASDGSMRSAQARRNTHAAYHDTGGKEIGESTDASPAHSADTAAEGVMLVDGQVVGEAHIRRAARVLALARGANNRECAVLKSLRKTPSRHAPVSPMPVTT